MRQITKGKVKIKLREAIEQEDGFDYVDAGYTKRYGDVVEISQPYERIGPPDYKVGDEVLVPANVLIQIKEGDDDYVICLQTAINQYDDYK